MSISETASSDQLIVKVLDPICTHTTVLALVHPNKISESAVALSIWGESPLSH